MSVTLILTLLGIVEPILATSGLIPSNYQPLAQGILNAISAVKAELTNASGGVTANAQTLIAGINAGVQALAAAGALGAASGIAKALGSAVAAGEQAEAAATEVDPTKLEPIAPVQ